MQYNLYGPLNVPFAPGNIYIMTFIDDYTRICWLYLLKNKFDYFKKFKKFHVMIEKEANTHIGTLNFDNGGEKTLFELKNYLS